MATIHGFHVISRVPSTLHSQSDVVLVDRGESWDFDRYVTGIVAASDDSPTEWFWGHYISDLRDATDDLLSR